MAGPILEVKKVSKSYVGVQALEDVDFAVQAGEVHCLVGENGSGKSTLIKAIGGAVAADSGEIVIDGVSYGNSVSPLNAIRGGIQIIYQDLSLFPNLTIAENISLNSLIEQRRRIANWNDMRDIAKAALDQLGETLDVDSPLDFCSMAQRQIVAIARALTQGAKLIIMDEPTSSITGEDVKGLFATVRRLNNRGVSMVFVSHKLNEVFEIAETVTVLRDGRKVGDYPAAELDENKLTHLMSGHTLEYKPFQFDPESESAPRVLETHGLTRNGQYSDVDLTIHAGEIVGLTGLVGSGRTELALSLFGMNPPDGGEIFVDGRQETIVSPNHAKRLGISYLPEDRHTQGLFHEQSIADNVVVTVIDRLRKLLGIVDRPRETDVWRTWVERLRIKTPDAQNAVSTLSGGNQQRVVLARWLAPEPKVFILDGPTIGVDVVSKARIHDTIQELAKSGMGILLISDEVSEVLQVCSRAHVMREGRLVAEFRELEHVSEHEVGKVVAAEEEVEVVS